MRIAVLLLILVATAAADPDWKAAEKLVRDRMTAQKLTVVDVQTRPERPFGTAFWVQVKDAAGKQTPRFVVVRGTNVYDTASDATLSAILKADDFLKTKKLDEKSFLYLVRELGKPPADLGTPITVDVDNLGLAPKLTFEKDRATFVVRSLKPGGAKGATPVRRARYTVATLTVATDYTVSWKVTEEERELK
jgi:hypothetical protein